MTPLELEEAGDAVHGAGAAAIRRVTRHATALSANPFESVLRAIAIDAGQDPVPQQAVDVGGRVIHPDLVTRLVLESDSWQWHTGRQAHVNDCWRYNALVVHGWTVLRFSVENVMVQPYYVREVLRLAGQRPSAQAEPRRSLLAVHDDYFFLWLWPREVSPVTVWGVLHLARGDLPAASETRRQAFARACQIGDPCWEGMSGRGLALVAEARVETERAFAMLAESRARCNRLADPYVWLDAHILDAQCVLGRRHGRPETPGLGRRDAGAVVADRDAGADGRAMLHAAALGSEGDEDAAAVLASDIENPVLDLLLNA